ncbi:hypothetical protein L873DRAFT_1810615 [Choiromyces venosus 120613-1]|uniref:Uncharacterized protein n=1 Tax=Choiromyces venosus 120613-1 TaxID=1336337 RepID=A0A3N4JHZ6_9PEZI|nr:hypothetical protein L873DRAFT_1810615 [Choiromyces venosus 120613-1]
MDLMDLIECKSREMFVSGRNTTHCLIHRMPRIQLNNYNTHLSLHHFESAIGLLEIIAVYDNNLSAGLFKKDIFVKISFKAPSSIPTKKSNQNKL